MERPRRHDRDPPRVDYKKSGDTDMRATRYGTDPRVCQRSFRGDQRFWLPFQADWYESVIMSMSHPTTEMRYIDWHHLWRLEPPVREVVSAVYAECTRKRLVDIMSLRCDWNVEVVAQFYATLHIHENPDYFMFTLGGKRFELGFAEFAGILGFELDDRADRNLHRLGVVDDSRLSFMYDMAYGYKCVHGQTHGLMPYYRLLNQLFRFTLTPRAGDADNISQMAKTILY